MAAIAMADGYVAAPVIEGVGAPPVFEFAEHVRDFVSLTVEAFVKVGA